MRHWTLIIAVLGVVGTVPALAQEKKLEKAVAGDIESSREWEKQSPQHAIDLLLERLRTTELDTKLKSAVLDRLAELYKVTQTGKARFLFSNGNLVDGTLISIKKGNVTAEFDGKRNVYPAKQVPQIHLEAGGWQIYYASRNSHVFLTEDMNEALKEAHREWAERQAEKYPYSPLAKQLYKEKEAKRKLDLDERIAKAKIDEAARKEKDKKYKEELAKANADDQARRQAALDAANSRRLADQKEREQAAERDRKQYQERLAMAKSYNPPARALVLSIFGAETEVDLLVINQAQKFFLGTLHSYRTLDGKVYENQSGGAAYAIRLEKELFVWNEDTGWHIAVDIASYPEVREKWKVKVRETMEAAEREQRMAKLRGQFLFGLIQEQIEQRNPGQVFSPPARAASAGSAKVFGKVKDLRGNPVLGRELTFHGYSFLETISPIVRTSHVDGSYEITIPSGATLKKVHFAGSVLSSAPARDQVFSPAIEMYRYPDGLKLDLVYPHK